MASMAMLNNQRVTKYPLSQKGWNMMKYVLQMINHLLSGMHVQVP